MRRAAVLALALAAAGCRGAPAPPLVVAPPPEPSDAWPTALATVQELVANGRHAEADSTLAGFSARHLGTSESTEALYWRALVRLDPENAGATPRDALAALDAYLAGGASLPHYQEALVLRRTASLLDGARRVPALAGPDTTTAALLPVSPDRLRATQDTVRALREELARTQAELERIRRRLRPPSAASPQ